MSEIPAVAELFYSGSWHDITATDDVLTRDPITITRDARPGSGKSMATLSLRNVSGKFSPRLPTSALYGLIGRNTPLRVSVIQARDTFTRTLADDWGTSSFGQAYTEAGDTFSAANFDVNGSQGTIQPGGTGLRRFATVETNATDFDVQVDIAIGSTPASGTLSQGVVGRFASTNHHYLARVQVSTTSAVTLLIDRRFTGITTNIATVLTSLTHVSGAGKTLRFRGDGTSLWAKVWDTGTAEPTTWTLSIADSVVTTGTGVGVYCINDTAVTTHVFSYDNFIARDIRFTGEVEAWPQRWNVKGSDVWSSLSAFGIMRRLGAPGTKAPSRSALWRLIAAGAILTPVAWWALEDGPLATITSSGLPGGLPMVEESATPGIGDCGPALPAVVDFRQGGIMRALVPNDGTFVAATGWSVEWTARFERNSGDAVFPGVMVGWRTDNASLGLWTTQAGTASGPALFFGNDSANQGSTGTHPEVTPYDGVTRHYRVTAKQNGANIDVALYADGVLVAVGDDFGGPAGTVTGTLARVTEVFVNDGLNGEAQPYNMAGLCHVTVYNSATHGIDTHLAAHGYVGETAAERIERLADEEGIAVAIQGDSALAEPVGVQRAASVLELLHDAADADGGMLFEPRGFLGLAYRTHNSLYNQTAAITLDYADGGEAAPPLAPVEDTAHVGNDITVTRYLGTRSRAVQETGTLNVQEPTDDPDGVGRIPKEFTLVLYADDQTVQQAFWKRHLGTWDEARYPQVNMDLTALEADSKTTLMEQAASLDIGDRLAITNPPAWLTYDDIEQHAQGFTEVIESHRRTIAVDATPARPYNVGILDDTTWGRLDNDACTLNEALDTTETGVDVVSVNTPWGSQFNYDIVIGGERMTVTARSGAGLSQTLTVTRSVNGVVKSHSSGAEVRLFNPMRLAR